MGVLAPQKLGAPRVPDWLANREFYFVSLGPRDDFLNLARGFTRRWKLLDWHQVVQCCEHVRMDYCTKPHIRLGPARMLAP